MMLVGKRPASLAELLDPLSKRFCSEDQDLVEEYDFSGVPGSSCGAAQLFDDGSGCGFRVQELPTSCGEVTSASSSSDPTLEKRAYEEWNEPSLGKRLCLGAGISAGLAAAQEAVASEEDKPESREAREVRLRTWAEEVVKTLHGCPSVEEALRRCMQVLEKVDAGAREAASKSIMQEQAAVAAAAAAAEAAAALAAERSPAGVSPNPQAGDDQRSHERLQFTNGVLMRALHNLQNRCRKAEASASESTALRAALDNAEHQARRLTSSTEVLQSHLKAHLDGCRCATERCM